MQHKNLTKNNEILALEKLNERLFKLEILYDKSKKCRIKLKKKLYASNKRIKQLEKERKLEYKVSSNKLKESLSRILNKD